MSTLRGLLSELGLKRRGKAMPSLGEYLATRGSNGAAGGDSPPQSDEHTKAQPMGSTEPESPPTGDVVPR